MAEFRDIYQIFRHIFSIIQYPPLKCIQIAFVIGYYDPHDFGHGELSWVKPAWSTGP